MMMMMMIRTALAVIRTDRQIRRLTDLTVRAYQYAVHIIIFKYRITDIQISNYRLDIGIKRRISNIQISDFRYSNVGNPAFNTDIQTVIRYLNIGNSIFEKNAMYR
ncbi:MAG: hypothetical protein ACKPKO_43015, partial [Candidatus Fonsibacter sp.]